MPNRTILVACLAMFCAGALAADALLRQPPQGGAAMPPLAAPPRQPAGGSLGPLAPAIAAGALHRLDRTQPERVTAEME